MSEMTELPPAKRDLSEILKMEPQEAAVALRDELYELCKRSGPITLAYSRVWYLWRTSQQAVVVVPDTRLRVSMPLLIVVGTIQVLGGFVIGVMMASRAGSTSTWRSKRRRS